MTTKDFQNTPRALPPEAAAAALWEGQTCADIGSMSISWWLEEVRSGRAPAPVVRRPRCTRWRAADVLAFWSEFASDDAPSVAAQVTAQAAKASSIAQANRRARAEGV